MTNLTKLVREYKKTKSKELLEKIFLELEPTLNKKAFFIYSKINEYKITFEELRQELNLKILTIIKNYKVREPFENYLFKSIKHWQPRLQIEDIINFESLIIINEEGEEEIREIPDQKQETPDTNLMIEAIFSECKTENEKKICELYLKNPCITEEELGRELGMTHQNISLILKKLRQRLKKYLQK